MCGNTKITLSNAKAGSISVSLSGTGNTAVNLSQLTADPDGAGGLEDLDGDGQFDDLTTGSSFKINFDETWNCTTSCPVNYTLYHQAVLSYSTMCGTSVSTPALVSSVSYLNVISSNSFIPSYVTGGAAFPVRLCVAGTSFAGPGITHLTDSLYAKISLPAGVAYVPGTATYNGTVIGAGDIYMSGNDLYIRKKSGIPSNVGSFAFCMELNLTYTCQPVNGTLSLPFKIYNVKNNSCSCNEELYCGTLTTTPMCPGGPCPAGPGNEIAKVERTSLGWTDATLATKVTAASLTNLSIRTMLPYDTFELKQSAIGGSLTYSNLYYIFKIDKAANQPVTIPTGGTVYYKRGGILFTCTLPAFDSTSSTSASSN